MVIIRSTRLRKAKESITCTDAMCLSTQNLLVYCINKLKRFETLFCGCFWKCVWTVFHIAILCIFHLAKNDQITFCHFTSEQLGKKWCSGASVTNNEIIQINDEEVHENTKKAIFTYFHFDHVMYHVTFWAACCFSPLREGKYCNRCWSLWIKNYFLLWCILVYMYTKTIQRYPPTLRWI